MKRVLLTCLLLGLPNRNAVAQRFIPESALTRLYELIATREARALTAAERRESGSILTQVVRDRPPSMPGQPAFVELSPPRWLLVEDAAKALVLERPEPVFIVRPPTTAEPVGYAARRAAFARCGPCEGSGYLFPSEARPVINGASLTPAEVDDISDRVRIRATEILVDALRRAEPRLTPGMTSAQIQKELVAALTGESGKARFTFDPNKLEIGVKMPKMKSVEIKDLTFPIGKGLKRIGAAAATCEIAIRSVAASSRGSEARGNTPPAKQPISECVNHLLRGPKDVT